MKTRLLAVLWAAFLLPATAQNSNFGTASNLQPSTVAQLPPAASAPNGIRHITNGNSATDCTVGGGSTKVTCVSNGSTWAAVGSSSGTGDVTHTGTLTSGKVIIGNGSADITVSSETGVLRASSGTLSGAELSGVVVTSASNVTTPGKVDVMQSSWFCSDAGANDTYTCNLSPAATAYVTGTHYRFKANTANTGAATINFNSVGAKTIVKVAGGITTTLADNDIRVGQWVDLVYDGTNMQMQSTLGNASSGSGTVSSGTINNIAKYTAGTTLGDSLLSDNGTTLTYTGTGGVSAPSFTGSTANGGIDFTEGTCANLTAAASHDLFCPESTIHRWKMSNNNGTYVSVVGSSTTAATSGNGVKFAANGYDIADSGYKPVEFVISFGTQAAVSQAATGFLAGDGYTQTDANAQGYPMTATGSCTKLAYTAPSVASGQTHIVTVQKAVAATSSTYVDTTVTCTVTGTATTCSDTAHSFTYAINDNLRLKIVASATAGTTRAAGSIRCTE